MKRKKNLLIGMTVASVAVMATATAFACTVFKGTFTLKGNASGASVTATGTGTGMSQTVSAGIAQASMGAGSVTVSTGKDAYNRALPAGSYVLRYYNSTATTPGYSTHYKWQTDCMYGGPGKSLTTVSVGSDGKLVGGAKTASLGASALADSGGKESAVCLSDTGGAFGNMAPVTIVL